MASSENRKPILNNGLKYRPKELDSIQVKYTGGKRFVTCFCGKEVTQSIVPHVKRSHAKTWNKWVRTFLNLSTQGYSWKKIMRLFSVEDKLLFSWTVVERAIREEIEAGKVIYKAKPRDEVARWQPEEFVCEKTTVWDFIQRGNWAVHSGDYRGNWPPQVPRNLIERYTNVGDLVIDAFAGGGTTLIEAWLMERQSVGLDISKLALQMMGTRLSEMVRLSQKSGQIKLNPLYTPLVIDGSALELEYLIKQNNLDTNKLRLICAHPPYLDSVDYTTNNANDLAQISNPTTFSEKMQTFARGVFNLLRKDGICAVLIGDVRKNNRTIPLGMMTLNSFLSEGFEIENIIIKTQHRDKSSEFWVNHKSDIILMAHEYLLLMKKG